MQLTSRSAGSARATARAPRSCASSCARSGVRFHTDTSLAPSRSSAQTAARALPPAPSTSARLPAGDSPRAAIKPGASVFSAAIAPPGAKLSVLAAPISRAASLALSASASAACLWGIVTFAPTKPAAAERAHGLREQLGRDGQQLIAPALHPERGERRVVHRRRAAVGDGPAEHAQARHHFLQTGGCPPFFFTAAW